MKASSKDFAQIAVLVVVFATAGAFVVSFVRGLGRPSPSPEQGERAAPWVMPSNVDGRAVGRVEVLNAAGRAGLAREATRTLRDAGFDVVFFGNSGAAADSSVVIRRAGSVDIAHAAAAALGIRQVVVREDTTLFVDVTVILGPDWKPGARRD